MRITLPVESAPLLRPVDVHPKENPDAIYCLTDIDRRNVEADVEMLRAWGQANKEIIEQYNATIRSVP